MGEERANQTDENLGLAAARGEIEAFTELLRRYQSPLLSFLRRMTPTLQDAEDLLQETVLRLYRSRDVYRSDWRYRTWAFTVARRVAIDAARRRANEVKAFAENLSSSQGSSPVATVETSDSADNVWDVARRLLTSEQVEALWLFHVEEMPPREIARILDRSWVSVKTMLHRARKRIRAEMVETMVFSTASGEPR